MRPWSRTTIRPAWRIVDSRWAMTIAVRPASRRRSPASMRPSVCRSTFDVASSRTRIRGSAIERAGERDELALAGRELHAALADLACRARPAGRSMNSHAPTARAARLDLLGGRVRAAERDVVADRPAEQERLLRDDPHLRAQRLRAHRRAGRGRRRARGRRSGRRSARRAWRTSTCPRRSRRRARRSGPGGTVIDDVLERVLRRLAVAAGSGTRRPRSAISPRSARQVDRVGRVGEVGLVVEQLEDLVERGHAGLVGRVDLRELADRVEEPVQRGDEADEHADLDVAVDHLRAADQQQRDRRHAR